MNIREPAVAGRFYPGNPKELKTALSDLFKQASPRKKKHQAALIVPHAGYVFSGNVAAEAFNAVDDDVHYQRIFVIGSSHTMHFDGASVYDGKFYRTPLGDIPIDREVVADLKKADMVHFVPFAHEREHSLEVQMPFIQHKWPKTPPVIPIVLGDNDIEELQKLAAKLRPYFLKENLFIISTDFSHYPTYDDAVDQDAQTADAIVSNKPEALKDHLAQIEKKNIAGLATPLCGWSSVLTLLYITSGLPVQFAKLKYRNSGDSRYGSKNEVVGYWAISVEWNDAGMDTFLLSENEKNTLLQIARDALKQHLAGREKPDMEGYGITNNLKASLGAFVSVYHKNDLRGCVGAMSSKKPLYQLIQDMAVSASVNDSRFISIKPEEVPDVKIEISVLTPLNKINDVSEVVPGRHGVYVSNGWQTGTLLPQVAEKMDWNAEQLLGHTARDKAGMTWDGWKKADVYTYEAIVFKEK